MSNLPSNEEQEGYIFYRFGTGLGYITLIIGYLIAILTTTHLTLLSFLVFTTLQVCYSVLLWWMIRNAWPCVYKRNKGIGLSVSCASLRNQMRS